MAMEAPELDRTEPGTGTLAVSFRHVGPVSVLAMEGALHAGTVSAIEAQVDRLGRTPCHQVVLDLAGLGALDDAGVRVLTGLHHYIAGRGGRLTVIGASPSVSRALDGSPLATSSRVALH